MSKVKAAFVLIALAVSPRDTALAERLLDRVERLSGACGHDAVLLVDQEVEPDVAGRLHVRMLSCFHSAQLRTVAGHTTWPEGANDMFRAAAEYAETIGRPWYFMEPDCTVLRAGWADDLEREYVLGGRPFMGAIEQHWIQATQWERVPDGHYLMGSAIYPTDLRRYTHAHLFQTDVPFDVAMRADLRDRKLVHPTRAILNCWNTVNYRRDGEQITCDANPLRTGQTGQGIARSFRPEEHVIVHGCKDGSLYDLLNAD